MSEEHWEDRIHRERNEAQAGLQACHDTVLRLDRESIALTGRLAEKTKELALMTLRAEKAEALLAELEKMRDRAASDELNDYWNEGGDTPTKPQLRERIRELEAELFTRQEIKNAAMSRTSAMWDLSNAVPFLQELHKVAFEAGYNIHLGGGVLTRGYSNSDLDVLLFPRYQVKEYEPEAILRFVASTGFRPTETYSIPNRTCNKVSDGNAFVELIFVQTEARLEWRPIETAPLTEPEDGCTGRFLLKTPTKTLFGWYAPKFQEWRTYESPNVGSPPLWRVIQPTHWMPLPSALEVVGA